MFYLAFVEYSKSYSEIVFWYLIASGSGSNIFIFNCCRHIVYSNLFCKLFLKYEGRAVRLGNYSMLIMYVLFALNARLETDSWIKNLFERNILFSFIRARIK